MEKLDKKTLEKVLDEIQKFIDENRKLENVGQEMGYKLALYSMYNHIYSIKFNQN